MKKLHCNGVSCYYNGIIFEMLVHFSCVMYLPCMVWYSNRFFLQVTPAAQNDKYFLRIPSCN